MDKWLIMEESVLATVEFLGLVGYEVLTAYAMKAFWPMNQKKKIIYLFWALLPLALMTMFHSENIGNDTRAYTDLFEAVKEMIPKIIHYCWFGGKELPIEVKKCIASWRKMCPDYEIIRWDESNFDVGQHPFVREAYKAKVWAFVSDYARLKVVYDNGGIYLDTDVELRKNLDSLREHGCYIGIQQNEFLCNTGLGFGATKSNPVLLKMLKSYDDLTFSPLRARELACPALNDAVIRSYGKVSNSEITELDEVTVYPPRYFDPYGGENLLCEDTYSIHHYAASWTRSGNKFKRRIARLIGQNNIIHIKALLKLYTNKI